MSRNISDLRSVMFETMAGLKDGSITAEDARAISVIGKVVIDSAKVEVDYLRINQGGESQFLETAEDTYIPDDTHPGYLGRLVNRIK